MKIVASEIPGVFLHGPDSETFRNALPQILGRAPIELLNPALPFSVMVENRSECAIALLGVRFNMIGPKAKQYFVVHYADSLRNPAKSDFRPGVIRFVCAEPTYTSLVMEDNVAPSTRGRMNLDNLRRMLQVAAAIDCVAFENGDFYGPDTHHALDRITKDRALERALVEEALATADGGEAKLRSRLVEAVQHPSERAVRSAGRKLLEALEAGGMEGLLDQARNYRFRIPLRRADSACA
jgi:hypothetical protein